MLLCMDEYWILTIDQQLVGQSLLISLFFISFSFICILPIQPLTLWSYYHLWRSNMDCWVVGEISESLFTTFSRLLGQIMAQMNWASKCGVFRTLKKHWWQTWETATFSITSRIWSGTGCSSPLSSRSVDVVCLVLLHMKKRLSLHLVRCIKCFAVMFWLLIVQSKEAKLS